MLQFLYRKFFIWKLFIFGLSLSRFLVKFNERKLNPDPKMGIKPYANSPDIKEITN